MGQEGWLGPQLGRAHGCAAASVGLFPSPLGAEKAMWLSPFSCGGFRQLRFWYEEALCSLVAQPVRTVQKRVWSVEA